MTERQIIERCRQSYYDRMVRDITECEECEEEDDEECDEEEDDEEGVAE